MKSGFSANSSDSAHEIQAPSRIPVCLRPGWNRPGSPGGGGACHLSGQLFQDGRFEWFIARHGRRGLDRFGDNGPPMARSPRCPRPALPRCSLSSRVLEMFTLLAPGWNLRMPIPRVNGWPLDSPTVSMSAGPGISRTTRRAGCSSATNPILPRNSRHSRAATRRVFRGTRPHRHPRYQTSGPGRLVLRVQGGRPDRGRADCDWRQWPIHFLGRSWQWRRGANRLGG